MKVLVQRVKRAGVEVEGKMVAAITAGLLVFVGVEKGDARPQAKSSSFRSLRWPATVPAATARDLTMPRAPKMPNPYTNIFRIVCVPKACMSKTAFFRPICRFR